MEPKIPDGSYCLFRTDRGGTRQGKLVLVWHRGCTDPALGGEFSVKKYEHEDYVSGWAGGATARFGLNLSIPIRLSQISSSTLLQRVTSELSASSSACSKRPTTVSPSPAEPTTSSTTSAAAPLASDRSQEKRHQSLRGQAAGATYAKALQAPFIFLTNGDLTYFWDYRNDDARQIAGFFSRRDLERMVEMGSSRKALATVEIPEYYIRQGETRTVRPYQRETMRALDQAFELGKRRFLIELPQARVRLISSASI